MGIAIDQIVPWGRSRKEYELMFGLSGCDLSRGVLDCGGGPASFIAELSSAGLGGIAVDPIYGCRGSDIRRRFDQIGPALMAQVRASPEDWVWGYHRSPDELYQNRRTALDRFLADYEEGFKTGRYVAGELPSLPFGRGAFGLAVCSHLLFLYSDLLGEEFHRRAAAELCRVADEVRIFPLLTLSGQPSPHLAAVRSAVHSMGWLSEVVRVDYELQRGGNEMLRIFHGRALHSRLGKSAPSGETKKVGPTRCGGPDRIRTNPNRGESRTNRA